MNHELSSDKSFHSNLNKLEHIQEESDYYPSPSVRPERPKLKMEKDDDRSKSV